VNTFASKAVRGGALHPHRNLQEIKLVQEGLWWMPLDAEHTDALRKMLLLAALGPTLGGLEGRVIFRAFGQYISLHPPWSYIVVTAALYGSAALVIMYCAGRRVVPGHFKRM